MNQLNHSDIDRYNQMISRQNEENQKAKFGLIIFGILAIVGGYFLYDIWNNGGFGLIILGIIFILLSRLGGNNNSNPLNH